MKVSVAICTWNRAELLDKTLASLRNLSMPAGVDWEVLVVNNASTDDTDGVLELWQGRLPLRRLFEPRSGQSFARNCAMRASSADVILWTDDDVLVERNWAEALLTAMEHWSADFAFGRSIPCWATTQPRWFSPLHNGRFALLDYGDKPFAILGPDTQFYGLNFATHRESLLRLGGFDETLGYQKNGGAAGEDTDLCRRAFEAGLKVVYTPDAVVQHIIPDARTTKQFYRDRLSRALDRNYDQLPQWFPDVPCIWGIPRFMFRAALSDAAGYLASTVMQADDKAFDYELRLRRFAGYLRAAAKRGWPGREQETAS